ncbi:hypothetical protein A7K69_09990 [Parageobacillus thermoglucosidasius]|uniref:Uncharacterized protein n=1 Tax=Parageobacillus thermoglucosidasius TaxID=1426 RepID=A0A1B7KQU1_PARTM|nr:hypothetical protein A7K69_09990 [Parageobacillus thermoglucosidasius]
MKPNDRLEVNNMEGFVDILLKVGVVFIMIFFFLIFVNIRSRKNNFFVECFSYKSVIKGRRDFVH